MWLTVKPRGDKCVTNTLKVEVKDMRQNPNDQVVKEN